MFENLIFDLVLILSLVAAYYYMIYRSRKGKQPYFRPIPVVDSLPELVGRATEMGRPIHFTGAGFISSTSLSPTIAINSMNVLLVLGELARLAAPYNTRIIFTVQYPEALPIAEDMVTAEATLAGNPSYKLDGRFIASSNRSFFAGVMGLIHREKVAGNVSFAGAESALAILDAGAAVGAMQIGGVYADSNAAWYVATCDYFTIGEESFAIAALLGNDPTIKASLAGEDLVKMGVLVWLILGAILVTAGNNFLVNLLKY